MAHTAYRILAAKLCRSRISLNAHLLARYASHLFVSRESYLLSLYARSTTIQRIFGKALIRIYRGKSWRSVRLTRWHVGFKAGELGRTRVMAVFRQKATRKKKPSLAGRSAQKISDARIESIRQVRSGQKRRSLGKFSPLVELQYSATSA